MAHPIRPESYISMDNFYTATVYEKGSEVIRMVDALLGRDGFRKGMDLYFDRHDGQAVTCDDFRHAMADATGRDLAQFERWYLQAGTPRVRAKGEFDAASGTYRLTLAQDYPETAFEIPGAADRRPLHMPVRLGLLARDGRALPVTLEGESSPGATSRVLELTEAEQTFVFTGLDEGARAVALPRLLGADSARDGASGRGLRPADGPRRGPVQSLGRGPAAGPRAAREVGDGGGAGRPASPRPGLLGRVGAGPRGRDPRRLAPGPGAGPAGGAGGRPGDGGDPARGDPRGTGGDGGGPGEGPSRRALGPLRGPGARWSLRPRTRTDRPTPTAQRRAADARRDGRGRGDRGRLGAVCVGRQHDRRAGGLRRAGRPDAPAPRRRRRGVLRALEGRPARARQVVHDPGDLDPRRHPRPRPRRSPSTTTST